MRYLQGTLDIRRNLAWDAGSTKYNAVTYLSSYIHILLVSAKSDSPGRM